MSPTAIHYPMKIGGTLTCERQNFMVNYDTRGKRFLKGLGNELCLAPVCRCLLPLWEKAETSGASPG